MTANPFAKKTAEVQSTPGFVKVMFNFMKETKASTKAVRISNGVTEYGTKFYARKLPGGSMSLPGTVVQAQDLNFVVEDGTRVDVSDNLLGQTMNVRLNTEEFQYLIEQAQDFQDGVGIEVTFEVSTGLVNIKQLTLTSKNNEERISYTVQAEVTDDAVESSYGTLSSDKLTMEQLNGYFNSSAAKDAQDADNARLANQAARETIVSAADHQDDLMNRALGLKK